MPTRLVRGMSLDVTYRVQIPHRAGQLAAVASVIARHEGLIGDVVTVNLGRDASIREITVDLLYGDHDGGQPTITRFVVLPEGQDRWRCDVARHWSLT